MQNMNIDKPWIDYIAKRTFGMELSLPMVTNSLSHFHPVTSGRTTN